MGIISNIFGSKSSSSSSQTIYLPAYITTHGDDSTTFTEEGAMRIITVYSCVRLIADTIGTLPIHVKRRMPDGSRVTVYNHPVAKLLNRPSPLFSRIDLMRSIIASEELSGNGYGYIAERDSKGYPTRIDYFKSNEVEVPRDIFFKRVRMACSLPSLYICNFTHMSLIT